MAENTIKCPNCSREIPLTEALSHQMKEGVRREYEAILRKKEDEIKKRAEELDRKASEAEEAFARRLAAEKERLASDARKKADEAVRLRIKAMEEENFEKDKLLNEARANELALIRKARELEEEKKALDLKIARTLDAEREKIRNSTIEMFMEEHRLKDAEKDKKISDMMRAMDELKRKGEQGSMQSQGEVLELDLEELLRARFPVDVIEPVGKGIRGADIIQRVYTKNGIYCGAIAWESKRTKSWNNDWITKLKDDQREVRAEVAVLVTETLPKDVASFAHKEGVWVTSVPLAASLAEALRVGLTQVALSRNSIEGRGEKMEAVYNYLSGAEFRHRVEAIVEAFTAMKADLEKEKQAMLGIWAKREKQIERVVSNTIRMYGDMQGIIGAALPQINSLELPGGEAVHGGVEGEPYPDK